MTTGFRHKKHLGQNFLIDPRVPGAIAEAAELALCDRVLEIGPGEGVLTRELASRAGQVVAVEVDTRLASKLEALQAQFMNLRIVWAEENIIEIPNGPRTMHEQKGKFCQMGTLRCPPGMSVADLRKWWLDEHAETGKHLAGLKWYTVLFPLRDAPGGAPPFDGYASVWYDSVGELQAAAGSKIMAGQMEDVRRHNMDSPDLSKVVLADEYIIAIA